MLDPKALDAAFGRLTATLVAALAKGDVIAIRILCGMGVCSYR
jgi:hypothetical protein